MTPTEVTPTKSVRPPKALLDLACRMNHSSAVRSSVPRPDNRNRKP
jgi:hypothetical protein